MLGRIADRMGNMFLPRGHPIQRAMRFHMAKPQPGNGQKFVKRPDLVDDDIRHFITVDLHLATPEAGQIGQRDMRADLHPVLGRQCHRLPHVIGVRAVETAGNIGLGDIGHDRRVIAHPVKAKAFTHVAIDINAHDASPLSAPLGRAPPNSGPGW